MLAPGALQSLVDSCRAGTAFSLPAGRFHDFRTIHPRSGDSFVGQGPSATTLVGSKPIPASHFTQASGIWVDSADVRFDTRAIAQADDPLRKNCAPAFYPQPAPNAGVCDYPDVLFMDGQWLRRVLGQNPSSPCQLSIGVGQYCVDYDTEQIFLGSDPTGHTFSFTGVGDGHGNLLQNAFQRTNAAGGTVTGVTVANLSVTRYANTDHGGGVIRMGDGWTVTNVVSSYNHGCGLSVGGKDPTKPKLVKNTTLTANGKSGFCGVNAGTTFDHNTVTYNNQDLWNVPFGAGGGKFSGAGPITVSNSVFSYNRGNGLATDVGESNVTISGNTFTGNTNFSGGGDGIHIEVSCFVTITGNTVSGNSDVGIAVTNSHDVNVGGAGAGNTVGPNGKAEIRIMASNRRGSNSCGRKTDTRNDVVLGNSVTLTGQSEVGIVNRSNCRECLQGTRFEGNSYSTGGSCEVTWWEWPSGSVQSRLGFGDWQTVAGQDPDGSCS